METKMKLDIDVIAGKEGDKKDIGQSSQEGGLVALIIGIDGYKHIDFRPLYCAVNDAVSLAGTLKKVWGKCEIIPLVWPEMERAQKKEEGYGITLPKDATGVTRENILEKVKNCAALCREPDTFIFYFSGHGVLTGDEPTLITIGDGKTAEGIGHIKIREIQEASLSTRCKKKIMILDCCQKVKDNTVNPKGYKSLKDLSDDWWIFLSCSPGETSIEDQYSGKETDGYSQQGIFTASLVEGLRGEATGSGREVTLAELASYVGKRVLIEYQERLLTLIMSKGENIKVHQLETFSQNPVLIGDGFAVGGPYQVIMAPRHVPTAHKTIKKWPDKSFLKYWFKYLFSEWPVLFPHKHAFREGGALMYAMVMFFTCVWESYEILSTSSSFLFVTMVGLGSAFIWWVMLPFAVAANEERWHTGGYVTALVYLLWHGIIVWWFWNLFGAVPNPSTGVARIYYLGIDLFLILAGVVLCGCNTSQTVIAIAETLRPENERGDIRQAIHAFQEFKTKTLCVTLHNCIAMLSAKPVFYYWIFGISLIITGINIFEVLTIIAVNQIIFWVFLLRSIFIMMFVGWLVVWYATAYNFFVQEVYKR